MIHKVSLRSVCKLLVFSLLAGVVLLGIRSYKVGLLDSVFDKRSISSLRQQYTDYEQTKKDLEYMITVPDFSGFTWDKIYTGYLERPMSGSNDNITYRLYANKISLPLQSSGFVLRITTGAAMIQLITYDPDQKWPSFLGQVSLYNLMASTNISVMPSFPINIIHSFATGMYPNSFQKNCFQYINRNIYWSGIPSDIVVPGCILIPYDTNISSRNSRMYISIMPLRTNANSLFGFSLESL